MSKLLQLSWKLLHPAESPPEAEVYERVRYVTLATVYETFAHISCCNGQCGVESANWEIVFSFDAGDS